MNSATTHRPVRPLYWSVRRELWEHRSLYMAPLIVAAVTLIGVLISVLTSMSKSLAKVAALDPVQQMSQLSAPYSALALMVLITSVLVGCFYCLDALHGERRDRSILFWKSLPVSDTTTVLAKAGIPMMVLPLIAFVIITMMQLVTVFVSTLVVLTHGISVTTLWSKLPFMQMPVGLFYFLVVTALWYAPVYAWLLFISAWAKRGTFVWAVVPPLALIAFVATIGGGSAVTSVIKSRLIGAAEQGFSISSRGEMLPDPVKFLSNPQVWMGLLIAAGLLFATIRLRRRREPL
ncbi:MAG: ABC transporter permease [Casimicrobium sp.]